MSWLAKLLCLCGPICIHTCTAVPVPVPAPLPGCVYMYTAILAYARAAVLQSRAQAGAFEPSPALQITIPEAAGDGASISVRERCTWLRKARGPPGTEGALVICTGHRFAADGDANGGGFAQSR